MSNSGTWRVGTWVPEASQLTCAPPIFGPDGPLVTSTKGITGHALGAAGAIEAVAVVLSMGKGLIPPTAGYATPDPDMPALNLVTGAPAPWEPGISMSNSFGFGGHNGSVVLAPA